MRPYEVRRSARRTMALELTREGRLLVRAPRLTPEAVIRRFVAEHEEWIAAAEARLAARQAAHPEPTEEQRKAMIRRAKEILPPKVAHYAALLGVTPTGLTVTSARSVSTTRRYRRGGSFEARRRVMSQRGRGPQLCASYPRSA